jgi:hypothetical protein
VGAMNGQDRGESPSLSDGLRRAEPHDRAVSESPSRQVRLEIDELVLMGFTGSEGLRIADSLRETLGQLFAGERTNWSRPGSIEVDRLDAGRVSLSRSGRARSAGEQVARAVYTSLPR